MTLKPGLSHEASTPLADFMSSRHQIDSNIFTRTCAATPKAKHPRIQIRPMLPHSLERIKM